MAPRIRHAGLVLREAEEAHWQLCGAAARFGADDINLSGDWTAYRADDEPQKKSRYDSNGCALFGTGHALVALAKFHGFDDFPKDISERYWGVIAGTTPVGTDPHALIETVRSSAGAIPASALPWTDDLSSFEQFYAPRPMESSLASLGGALLDRFEIGHEWVFAFGSTKTPKEKAELLAQALKRGTVCVSVDGAYRMKKGKLTKARGATDTHWVQLLRPGVIFDQYEPYLKELAPGYDHSAAKVYFLKRRTGPKSFWSSVWEVLAGYWRFNHL